jgi:pantoate kinase
MSDAHDEDVAGGGGGGDLIDQLYGGDDVKTEFAAPTE